MEKANQVKDALSSASRIIEDANSNILSKHLANSKANDITWL